MPKKKWDTGFKEALNGLIAAAGKTKLDTALDARMDTAQLRTLTKGARLDPQLSSVMRVLQALDATWADLDRVLPVTTELKLVVKNPKKSADRTSHRRERRDGKPKGRGRPDAPPDQTA